MVRGHKREKNMVRGENEEVKENKKNHDKKEMDELKMIGE